MLNLQIASTDASRLFVSLEGEIQEQTRFGVLNLEGRDELHINARGIQYINSAGICKWVQWMADLKAKSPRITIFLNEVPYDFLKQVITVDGFIPEGSEVHSAILPYTCNVCLRGAEKIFTAGKDYSPNPSVEEIRAALGQGIPCVCGSAKDLDAQPNIIIKALVKFSPKSLRRVS
jgi:hypothetical protein